MSARELPDATLARRVDALGRFVTIVTPHVLATGLPRTALGAAESFVDHAAARLRLSATDAGGHTIVALAGATGGGKSSLFNALAHLDISPVGSLRPTTGAAHACVWGPHDADELLDWLGVAPGRRYQRESVLDADDEAALRGLVLLDLPDMDTLATSHRAEADRLVGVVDLVVWVLDPQKYADQAVHDGYLRELGALADVTMVVLNQVDRLRPADAARCRDDLARLVEADGLPGVPIVSTSARTGEGIDELRSWLEKTIGGRPAVLARIESELEARTKRLAPLVGERLAPSRGTDLDHGLDQDGLARPALHGLADDLAGAVGVDALVAQATRGHAGRSRIPVARRVSRDATIPPADAAAVRLAVRQFATSAGGSLPSPWVEQVWSAARLGLEELPDQLARGLSAARPYRPRATGWAVARGAFWFGLLTLLAGLGWAAVDAVRHRGSPVEHLPRLGAVPVPWILVVAGAVIAAAMLALRPLARARTARFHDETLGRLRDAVATIAAEVAAPVRRVLRDSTDARDALDEAAAGPASRDPG